QGNLYDALCSAAHFVARAVAGSLQRFLPELPQPTRVFLSGGGVRNGLLWRLLEQHLTGAVVDKTDRLGVPAETRQAAAFGILAALTLDGVPGNALAATGAAGARLLGSLTPGSTNNWTRCLAWMAAQSPPLESEEG